MNRDDIQGKKKSNPSDAQAECRDQCEERNWPGQSTATLNVMAEQAVPNKPAAGDRQALNNFADTGAQDVNNNNRRPPDLPTLVEEWKGVQFHPAQLVNYSESASVTAEMPTSSVATRGLILPVVVSLLYYDNVKGHLGQPAPAGYPVVCVPLCDTHHPGFATRGASCKGSTRNGPPSNLFYTWEAGATDDDGSVSFETISQETPFAAVQHRVLDSMYISSGSTVRCIVQETRNASGHRLTFSEPVVISGSQGICVGDKPHGQDVTASMEYLNGTGPAAQAGRLHITVRIRHRDSMLPLISTHPLPSAEQLFGNVVSQKQHICSNVAGPGDHGLAFAAFMKSTIGAPRIGEVRPYQSDSAIRGSSAVSLYHHLDLNQCLWTFEAIISLKDAVGLCGGVLLEDFKEPDSHRRFVTVRLPLYVTLAFPAFVAAVGDAAPRWTSVERRSQLELSFAYGPAMWSERPLGTRAPPKAKVSVTRVSLARDGRLSVHLLTKALFHGLETYQEKLFHLLDDVNNHSWLVIDQLENFSKAIYAKGARLTNCWGFTDGTAPAKCQRTRQQPLYFSGHKKFHALKYQPIICPNGIICHLDGCYPGSKHDAGYFGNSLAYTKLEKLVHFYCIYGDPDTHCVYYS
ncbi:hypothetical protein MRX96_013647 [Rhipicephalus microplus]